MSCHGNNQNQTFIINTVNDITITGTTFTNNNLVLTNSTGGTITQNINNLSGLTVSGLINTGSLSASTITGSTSVISPSISATTYQNLPKIDMQTISASDTITAAVLADVGSMTLTAKNLSSSATTYQVRFDAQLSNNNNAGSSSIRIVKNGTLASGSVRTISNGGASLTNANRIISTSCAITGVTSGDIIKVQFSASTGTVTLTERTLTILGILNSGLA